MVISCEAPNGSSMVAKASAAGSSLSGAIRRPIFQISHAHNRYASAEGRRAAQGLRPNVATLPAIAQ